MSKLRATLIIILVILVCLLVFGFIYEKFMGGTTPWNGLGNSQSQQNEIIFPSNGNTTSSSNSNTNQFNTTQINLSNSNKPFHLPVLREIWNQPVAGYIAFTKASPASTTAVRFIERATGHIYETSSTASEVDRISDSRIPEIYEAFWNTAGTSVYARYLESDNSTIDTYFATLGKAALSSSTPTGVLFAPLSLSGSFLPTNVENINISPTKNSTFYLITANTAGGPEAEGVLANPDGSNPFLLFVSPLTQLITSWPKANLITLTTKPSGTVVGHLLFLNTSTGGLTDILSGQGLTTNTNPDGTLVLESTATTDNNISTSVYTVKTGASTEFALPTMPEKCVWSKKNTAVIYCAIPQNIPSGLYPDDWYQGTVSFDDSLWQINTQTGTTNLLFTPSLSSKMPTDVILPSLSPDEKFLYFVNKNDGTLWSLDMSQSTAH